MATLSSRPADRSERADHAFVGRGNTCELAWCGKDYRLHTDWPDSDGSATLWPDADLVGPTSYTRHLESRERPGAALCGTPVTIKRLRPSDGLYAIQMCERCDKAARSRGWR